MMIMMMIFEKGGGVELPKPHSILVGDQIFSWRPKMSCFLVTDQMIFSELVSDRGRYKAVSDSRLDS